MKFLLVIPALVLFLSNIPFVHKMDMKEMMAAMKKSGCCKKDADEGKCPMQDATCVCICCFQYAAPDQVAAKLQFGLAGSKNNLAGYLQQHWKDPHLTAPWQPPDVINVQA